MGKLVGSFIGCQFVCTLCGLWTWPLFEFGFLLAQFLWTVPIMMFVSADVALGAKED